MHAVVITIGDEILNGTTVDTNSAFLGRELSLLGIQLMEKISISDTDRHIRQTLDRYMGNTELIIMTGGLGPTLDDVTKQTLCTYFDTRLEFNDTVFQFIANRFAQRGLTMTERNRQQAYLPASCTVVPNTMGTAAGMWFERAGTVLVSLPGVPYEMQHIYRSELVARFQAHFTLPAIVNYHIMTSGIGESWLADKIEDIETSLPADVTLAYLPSPGIVKLRLTGRGADTNQVVLRVAGWAHQIEERLGAHVYGKDNILLQEAIGNRLNALQATVSLAESCTGGNIGRLITQIPGSSAYFLGSVISYDNSVKERILGVSPDILAEHGAVSEATVAAMLAGVLQLIGTDYAIAVSGVAGPGGGTDDKPVGTVYIGVSGRGTTRIKRYNFAQDRQINIEYSSMYALHMLRVLLDEHLEKQELKG